MIDTALAAIRRRFGARPDAAAHAAADAFAATCDADAHRAANAFRNWLTQFEGSVAAA